MMKTCVTCLDVPQRIFCPVCGKLLDRAGLESVRLMGPVGVFHSSSPKTDEFFATGDPSVFEKQPA